MKKIDGMNLLPCHNTWSYATQSYRITSVCKFVLCNTYIFFQTITKNPPSKIYYRNDYFYIDFFLISKKKKKNLLPNWELFNNKTNQWHKVKLKIKITY